MNDIPLHCCTVCGQVRMDQAALQRLAGPIDTPAPTPAQPTTPTRRPYQAPPVPPLPGASFLGGVTLSPAPPPLRTQEPPSQPESHVPYPPSAATIQGPEAVTKAAPAPSWTGPSMRKTDSTRKAPSKATPRPTPIATRSVPNPTLAPGKDMRVTPGVPPKRAPTPRPPSVRSVRGMPTVLPFAAVDTQGESSGLGDMSALSPASDLGPAASLQGHSVRPQSTWIPDQIPTTIDDSRVPTDELAPQELAQRLGLRSAISSPDHMEALGLRAAVTRHDEPGLGLGPPPGHLPDMRGPNDRFLEDETEEMERFFTEETADNVKPPPVAQRIELDDLDYKPRKKTGLALVLGLGLGVLLLVAAGAAFYAFNPSFDLQAALSPAPKPAPPSLSSAALGDVDPDTASEAAMVADSDEPAVASPDTDADPADETGDSDDDAVADDIDAGSDAPPEAKPVEAKPVETKPVETKPVQTNPVVRKPSYRGVVERGWREISSKPEKAADTFREAMDLRPGDAEASYGLGYALLKMGQKNGARAYLCGARKTADSGTIREIDGVLSQAQLACEDSPAAGGQ